MLTLIKNVILLEIKDIKGLMFMIFFPVFLVLVIGTALTNMVSSDTGYELEKSTIYYYSEDENQESIYFLKEVMEGITSEDGEELFEFKEAESIEKAKNLVRSNRKIFILQKDDNIGFYSNDQSIVRPSYVYGTMKAILRERALKEITYRNYLLVGEEFKSVDFKEDFEEVLIEKEKSVTSMDYYGVAELSLIMLYYTTYALHSIRKDSLSKVRDRIIINGISNFQYYLSKFIGMLIYSYVSINISYIICRLCFNINYGKICLFPLAMIPLAIVVNGIGTVTGVLSIKSGANSDILSSIIQTVVIPAMSMLGGGYFATDFGDKESLFSKISYISPITWFNKGIFRYLYLDDISLLKTWGIIGASFLILTILILYYLGKRSDENYEKYTSIN